MKAIIIVFATVLFSFSNLSAQGNFHIDNSGIYPKAIFHKKKDKVEVQAGKMVTLRTIEMLNSSNLVAGQIIRLMVDANVSENGKVVIKSNAFALGRVKAVTTGSLNHRATLTIEVTSVQSVDGQQIPLHGQEQIFPAAAEGENVVLSAGQTMLAYFKNDENIVFE